MHLPILEVPFPANALTVFQQAIDIPCFNMIPGPDKIISYIFRFRSSSLAAKPFSDNFDSIGYHSLRIVENLDSVFLFSMMYSFVALIVLVLKVLSLEVRR